MRLFRLSLAVVACLAAGVPSAIGKNVSRGGPFLSKTAASSQSLVSHTSRAETPSSNIVKPGGAVAARKTVSLRGGEIPQKALSGAITMALLERGINKIFAAKGIGFPSPLGCCISLLTFMLLADVAKPGLGESIFAFLAPGQALLTKWLPVFFVPGIAMLPLAPSMGSGLEVR